MPKWSAKTPGCKVAGTIKSSIMKNKMNKTRQYAKMLLELPLVNRNFSLLLFFKSLLKIFTLIIRKKIMWKLPHTPPGHCRSKEHAIWKGNYTEKWTSPVPPVWWLAPEKKRHASSCHRPSSWKNTLGKRWGLEGRTMAKRQGKQRI